MTHYGHFWGVLLGLTAFDKAQGSKVGHGLAGARNPSFAPPGAIQLHIGARSTLAAWPTRRQAVMAARTYRTAVSGWPRAKAVRLNITVEIKS